MDEADMIANADRPVVQDCDKENHVQIVFPETEMIIQLHAVVFMSLMGEGMRILGDNPLEEYR